MRELTTTAPDPQVFGNKIYFPYDITFADSDTSPATVARVETCLARLAKHYDRIVDSKVVVRIRQKKGLKLFHLHVVLDVPGKRLAVGRDHEADDSHAEIGAAIKDAFLKITRQLDDFVKIRKAHKPY